MKYLWLLLPLLTGCSEAPKDNSQANSNFTEMCVCAAQKRNFKMFVFINAEDPTKSSCRLIQKTESNWQMDLNPDQLDGLRKAKQLDKYTKAPQYEACMKKRLGALYDRKPPIDILEPAAVACSKSVFKETSIWYDDTCAGF